uniref:SKP1-like protein 21 isoform X5 n=1 Tax=Rhizophora mucronata TaxID=61149 RepID=A0A2P2KYR2_RHIMU
MQSIELLNCLTYSNLSVIFIHFHLLGLYCSNDKEGKDFPFGGRGSASVIWFSCGGNVHIDDHV